MGSSGSRVEAAGSPAARLAPPRLVGRDDDLGRLVDALATPPAIVSIEGEAGVGKTRLLNEMLRGSGPTERETLVAVCPPYREAYTLGPIVDSIRQAEFAFEPLQIGPLGGDLRHLFPEWADRLPVLLAAPEDATAQRRRLFSALATFVSAAGIRTLVLEDAHWADDATLELLLFLAAHRPLPLSLVVTFRREDTAEDSLLWRLLARPPVGAASARIALEPLDEAGTALLISSMLDDLPVSREFAGLVHRSTEGLPLAIEESIRLLGDRSDVARRDGEWIRRRIDKIAVPPTVRDAVLERAARLGGDARAMLEASAILIDPSDEAALAAVADCESATRAGSGLDQVLASGLLVEDGGHRVSFRHALASRAIYDAIPASRRKAMHLRAARALETRTATPLVRLAAHCRAAGDLVGWCRYGEQAADVAHAAGDQSTAEGLLYEVAVIEGLPVADLVRVTGKIRFASLTGSHRYLDLVEALRRPLAEPGLGATLEADLRRQLGRVLIAIGEFDAGRVELELAVANLGHDPLETARTMLMLGLPHGTDAAASTHLEWLRRAAEVPPPAREVDRLGLLVDRASLLLTLGEDEGWIEARRIPFGTSSTELMLRVTRGNLNVGDQAIVWGRYAEARRRLDAALTLATANDFTRASGVVRVTLLHLDWLTGSWQGLGERARALADVDGLVFLTPSEAVLVDGLLALVHGDSARAEELLGPLVEMARGRGAAQHLMEPAAALARLWVAQGRIDKALDLTAEAMDAVQSKGIWIWATEMAPARAEALVAGGRIGDAARLVDRFAVGLGERPAPAAQAALIGCRGLVAAAARDEPRAANLFGAAAYAWAALPRPYDSLLARERQALCWWAIGDADAAARAMRGVARRFAKLGAAADGERAEGWLHAAGRGSDATHVAGAAGADGPDGVVPVNCADGVVPVDCADEEHVWRGGSRGYGDRLSPRELEVVRLVAAGQTNKEIASSLCRSRHTIDNQLKSAMRKWKVTTRTLLAVRATEQGVVAPGDTYGSCEG